MAPDALLARDGLPLALARAGVAPRPLASDGQPPAMPIAAVASDILEPLNVLLDLPAECALDDVTGIDDRGYLADLLVRQLA